MIHHGDCLEVMAGLDPESVDAVVTDPPYLISFMGKGWDAPEKMSGHATPNPDVVGFYQAIGKGGGAHDRGHDAWQPNRMGAWHTRWAEAAYRVAKPSAYLLAFGGTRTVHRMTVALEDAGWIIRDMLVWAYASGFPKSKASLKPAWEPIVMARKPGPLRMLAIDECRIAGAPHPGGAHAVSIYGGDGNYEPGPNADGNALGRWPANLVLTDPIFDGDWEGVVGGGQTNGDSPNRTPRTKYPNDFGWSGPAAQTIHTAGFVDSGTYSRFFILPKADRADREPVLGGLPVRATHELGEQTISTASNRRCRTCGLVKFGQPHCECKVPVWEESSKRQNYHPTVKPVDLMRHLVRLVTPTGGTVLDPFLGSGTTGLAAEMEGFEWIGIEKEAEYVAIAEARLNGTQRGLGLPA